jgi:ParB family chromosome partitioning protein
MLNFGAMISQENQVKQIPLDLLIPYHNHKFKLYEGERLNDMLASIQQNGILTPIIVRPMGDKYEILAGHNRTNAAKLAGLNTVPAIIKENLSDIEAEMYVVETNLMQRGFDDLRISEQAAVLAMRHSQMFTEEKRAAIQSELSALEGNSPAGNSKLAKVGEEYGMCKNSVARLVRIDKLIDPLKELVDEKTISIRAAVELSYISETAQEVIFERCSSFPNDFKIDIKFAKKLREVFEGFTGTVEQAKNIYPSEDCKEKKPKAVKIKADVYNKFFDENTSAEEIENTIQQALKFFFDNNQQY